MKKIEVKKYKYMIKKKKRIKIVNKKCYGPRN